MSQYLELDACGRTWSVITWSVTQWSGYNYDSNSILPRDVYSKIYVTKVRLPVCACCWA